MRYNIVNTYPNQLQLECLNENNQRVFLVGKYTLEIWKDAEYVTVSQKVIEKALEMIERGQTGNIE